MYHVTRLIHFCYGHRLLDYQGKCRHLHGHNGRVEIELSSEGLDRRGMVRDFEEIKQTIQTWIDRELDHTMLLNRKDPVIPVLRQAGERLYLMDQNPTAEAIARLIFDYAVARRLPVTEVRLWETDRSVASYRSAAARPRRRTRGDTEPGRDRTGRARYRRTGRRTRSISTAA